MSLMTLLERGIEGDLVVLIEVPFVANDGYNDCCDIFGITCQKEDSFCGLLIIRWHMN